MSEALRLAEELEYEWGARSVLIKSATELRRLHAENEALKAELLEQARVNGMGGEREARLMALNAELVEALKNANDLDADANALAASSSALADSVDKLTALNAELVEVVQKAVKLNSFREFNDHIPAMKAALAKASK